MDRAAPAASSAFRDAAIALLPQWHVKWCARRRRHLPRRSQPASAGRRSPICPRRSAAWWAAARLVGELAGRLARRRFLTIVGPGGMGKTTVALALAERLSATYQDGARFVDLASLATSQTLLPPRSPGRLRCSRSRATRSAICWRICATGRCCCCSTIASMSSMLSPHWRKRCSPMRPACISWRPAASHCASRANSSAACRRSGFPPNRRT